MPIRYTCSACSQRLSISRKKAGEEVACPSCGAVTRVPFADEDSEREQRRETPQEPSGIVFSEWRDSSAEVVEAIEREEEWEDRTEREEEPLAAEATSEPGLAAERVESPAVTPISVIDDDGEEQEPGEFQIRKPQTDFEEMDLTPMVDVTFLLLIFFMLTASFSLQKTIPTPVPEQNEQSASQPLPQEEDPLEKSILIEIDANNRIFLDEELVADARGLEEALREKINREQKNEVLVDASGEAFNVTVVEVLDAAREVGMQRIRMSFPRNAEAGD